jgi:hypothetical protein
MTASLAVWAVLAGVLAVLWALSHARSWPVRPAALLVPLAARPVLRIALAVAWMWVGWHLFAR